MAKRKRRYKFIIRGLVTRYRTFEEEADLAAVYELILARALLFGFQLSDLHNERMVEIYESHGSYRYKRVGAVRADGPSQ